MRSAVLISWKIHGKHWEELSDLESYQVVEFMAASDSKLSDDAKGLGPLAGLASFIGG